MTFRSASTELRPGADPSGSAEPGGDKIQRLAVRTPFTALIRRTTDYLLLTKPWIVSLLLLTTFCGMVAGAGRLPDARLVLLTLLGGALTAGGSGAINQYLDRTVDLRMTRTSRRPIPAGRVRPQHGLWFGLALCALGVLLLALTVNLISAGLALIGILYYVVLYSMLLKTQTPANIVIGGGAGAIPPLVGWAAAAGSLSPEALLLFAVVFAWTPAHFWALALLKQADYRRAGIPMLPIVAGESKTRRQILLYSVASVGLTLLMPLVGLGQGLFLAASIVLGAGLLGLAWSLLRNGRNRSAWRMYRYSSLYLAGVFCVLAAEVLLTA